jgi:hypothetical protein
MKEAVITYLNQVRWNHAIEHGVIHVLSRMMPFVSMAGRSNGSGFFIYGNIPTDMLELAVQEAVDRISAGEHQLAIHPNCGTNIISSAVLAASGTMLATTGTKRRGITEQIPAGVLGALMGVVMGQVVGMRLQALVTTNTHFPSAHIKTIQRRQAGKRVYHWIEMLYSDEPSH